MPDIKLSLYCCSEELKNVVLNAERGARILPRQVFSLTPLSVMRAATWSQGGGLFVCLVEEGRCGTQPSSTPPHQSCSRATQAGPSLSLSLLIRYSAANTKSPRWCRCHPHHLRYFFLNAETMEIRLIIIILTHFTCVNFVITEIYANTIKYTMKLIMCTEPMKASTISSYHTFLSTFFIR